jgi:hypothetical protein
VWHASVALMKKGKVLKVEDLSASNKRVLAKTAKGLLAGVGQTPSKLEQYPLGIHYRRSLTDEEIGKLPADWCAIPAVDLAGHGILLEQDT